MRRAKSSRPPRGILLVPELKDGLLEAPEEESPVDEAHVDDPSPAPTGSPPPDEEPTAERLPSVLEPPSPADFAHPTATASPSSPVSSSAARDFRRLARPAGFLALLALLVVAGVLVGRAVRDEGAEPSAAPATSTPTPAKPAGPTPKPAPARPASERWGPLQAKPAGRLARPAVKAAAAIADGRLVVLGGSTGSAVQVGKPGGDLRQVASLPSPRASAAAFADGAAVYLIGGERGDERPSDEVLRYDLASRAVTPAGTFIEPLAGAGYAQSGGAMYLVGGWTGEKLATAVLRFNLPDDATVVARLPEATRDPAVALLGGKLYVAGGRTASGLTDAVYEVDLAAGTVAVLGRLPQRVAGASLVVAGGELFLLGGVTSAGPVAALVRIDPATGRIDSAGRMPRPLAGATSVRRGAATLVLGGTRPKSIRLVESR
jgi:hypothetical protein